MSYYKCHFFIFTAIFTSLLVTMLRLNFTRLSTGCLPIIKQQEMSWYTAAVFSGRESCLHQDLVYLGNITEISRYLAFFFQGKKQQVD